MMCTLSRRLLTDKSTLTSEYYCILNNIFVGIIDQCVLDERWVGVIGKGTTLNGVPVHTTGAPSLKQSMAYATTPEMFKPGYERQRCVLNLKL